MKKPFKTKVTIDGVEKDVTIELDTENPPAGFIAEDKHSELLESETKRSFDRGKRNAKSELLKDEAFQAEAAESWGLVKKGEGGKGKLSTDELTTHLENWRKGELEPVRQKLTAAEQANQQLLDDILAREIVAEASRLGMIETFTEGVEGDLSKAGVVAMFRSRMAYDPETRMFAARRGESWEFNPKGSKTRPYKGAKEILEEFKGDDRNAAFFKNQRQEVPGAGGGEGGSKGVKTVSREDLTRGNVDIEALAKGQVQVAD